LWALVASGVYVPGLAQRLPQRKHPRAWLQVELMMLHEVRTQNDRSHVIDGQPFFRSDSAVKPQVPSVTLPVGRGLR
jgi:hypothetical protein